MTFETFGQSDEGTLQDQKETLTTTMTTTKTMTKKMTKTMTKTNIFREHLKRAIPETYRHTQIQISLLAVSASEEE